ncbi:MAG: solute carrier family 23 protein, partial [Clostridia bacterium]|nr:solute carrier family 23 protein [Clostridia bacterium]
MTQNSAGADLSLKQNMALGLQHFLAVFVSNMTPMLIVTNLIHLPEGERMALVQATMVIAGLATIFQLKRVGIFGSELPMFIGSNANFLPILMAIAVSYGMEGILGATIVGGLVAILFGIFIKPLSRFIPNVVAGTVVLSVGLSLIPISVDYWAGGTGAADYGSLSNLFLGFIVLTVILVLQEFAGGFIKKAAVLFGIFVGYVAAIIMNKVDFMPLMQASMVSLPEFMPFRPAFHLDAIIAVAIIYIAVCVKMVG